MRCFSRAPFLSLILLPLFLACTYPVETPHPTVHPWEGRRARTQGDVTAVILVSTEAKNYKATAALNPSKYEIKNLTEVFENAVMAALPSKVGPPTRAREIAEEGLSVRIELERIECDLSVTVFSSHSCLTQARYTLYDGGESNVLRDYRAGTRSTEGQNAEDVVANYLSVTMAGYRNAAGRAVLESVLMNVDKGLEALAEKVPLRAITPGAKPAALEMGPPLPEGWTTPEGP